MQLIERNEIKGEEAAALIAVLPKTIREPTEEMQRRFVVSRLFTKIKIEKTKTLHPIRYRTD